MKLKRFEVFLGDKWVAWAASDTLTITQRSRVVTILNNHEGEDYTTVIDLDIVPAYTFAKA